MALKTEIISQAGTREISPNNLPSSTEVANMQAGMAIIAVAFTIALAFIFFKQAKYQKKLYSQLFNLKRFSSIPCHKCQFYDNNQHLACAVQPAVVLSPDAVNCSDYKSRKR
ncbi:MAG: hypothetical protein KI793_08655 [Rivularia sp. (in: Bacteria)]|nr:hypothetical protein [Rivularia sp. MS3]